MSNMNNDSSLNEMRKNFKKIRGIWLLALAVGFVLNPGVVWLMFKLPNGLFFDIVIYVTCASVAISAFFAIKIFHKLFTYSYGDFCHDIRNGKSIEKIANLM